MYNCGDCGISFPSAPLLSNHRQRFCRSSRVDLAARQLLGDGSAAHADNAHFLPPANVGGQPAHWQPAALDPRRHHGGPGGGYGAHQPGVYTPEPRGHPGAFNLGGEAANHYGSPTGPSGMYDRHGGYGGGDGGGGFGGMSPAGRHHTHGGAGVHPADAYQPRDDRAPYNPGSPTRHLLSHGGEAGGYGAPQGGSVIEGRYGLRVFAAEGLLAFNTVRDGMPMALVVRQYYCRRRIGQHYPEIEQRDECYFDAERAVTAARRDGYLNFGRPEYIFNVVAASEVILVAELVSAGRLVAWAEVVMDSLGDKARRLRHPPVDIAGALNDFTLRATSATLGMQLFRGHWDDEPSMYPPPIVQHVQPQPIIVQQQPVIVQQQVVQQEVVQEVKAATPKPPTPKAATPKPATPPPRERTPEPEPEPAPEEEPAKKKKKKKKVKKERKEEEPQELLDEDEVARTPSNIRIDSVEGLPFMSRACRCRLYYHLEGNKRFDDRSFDNYQLDDSPVGSPQFDLIFDYAKGVDALVVVIVEIFITKPVVVGHAVIPVGPVEYRGNYACRLRRGLPDLTNLLPDDSHLNNVPCAQVNYRLCSNQSAGDGYQPLHEFTKDEEKLIGERAAFVFDKNITPLSLGHHDLQMPIMFREPAFDNADFSSLVPFARKRDTFFKVEQLRGIDKNLALHKVFMSFNFKSSFTQTHDWASDLGAPIFLDQPMVFENVVYDQSGYVSLTLYRIDLDDAAANPEPVAFAVAPMFADEPFLKNGRYTLPWFDGELTAKMKARLRTRPVYEVIMDSIKDYSIDLFEPKATVTIVQGDVFRRDEFLKKYLTRPRPRVLMIPPIDLPFFPMEWGKAGKQGLHGSQLGLVMGDATEKAFSEQMNAKLRGVLGGDK
jgi:hypothetical protein